MGILNLERTTGIINRLFQMLNAYMGLREANFYGEIYSCTLATKKLCLYLHRQWQKRNTGEWKSRKQSTNRGVLKEEDHGETNKIIQVSVYGYGPRSVKYIKEKNLLITRNMKRSHNMYHWSISIQTNSTTHWTTPL